MVKKEEPTGRGEQPPMGEMIKDIVTSYLPESDPVVKRQHSWFEVGRDLLPTKITDLFTRHPNRDGPSDFDPPQEEGETVWQFKKISRLSNKSSPCHVGNLVLYLRYLF